MESDQSNPAPIACSLSSEGLAERSRSWQALLRSSVRSREEVRSGLSLEVVPSAVSVLRDLVELERECCAWIAFDLDGPVLTMTASDDGVAVLRQMFSLQPDPA